MNQLFRIVSQVILAYFVITALAPKETLCTARMAMYGTLVKTLALVNVDSLLTA